MMQNKKFIKQYFSFSGSERNGIIVLLILLFLIIVIPEIYFSFKKDQSDDNVKELEAQIKKFQESMELKKKDTSGHLGSFRQERFIFDPNKASFSDWSKLGLKDYQIRTIENYKKAGGIFYSAEDLKKIYTIPDSIVSSLMAYMIFDHNNTISIKKIAQEKTPAAKEIDIEKPLRIDLNHTNEQELMQLEGIGEMLSKRIVKYRDILGGFYSADQLTEVFGITPATYGIIKDKVFVNGGVNKIDLNSSSIELLEKHPYISRFQAKAIKNYKQITGKIVQPYELVENNILPDSTYQKLLPYLKISD